MDLVDDFQREARNAKRRKLRAKGNPELEARRKIERRRIYQKITVSRLLLRGWLHAFLLMMEIETRRRQELQMVEPVPRHSYTLDAWIEQKFFAV